MTLDEYMTLPYATQIVLDEVDGKSCFFVSHPELPGCMAQGGTAEEAIASLRGARELYIESLLEDGMKVPTPPGASGAASPAWRKEPPPPPHMVAPDPGEARYGDDTLPSILAFLRTLSAKGTFAGGKARLSREGALTAALVICLWTIALMAGYIYVGWPRR